MKSLLWLLDQGHCSTENGFPANRLSKVALAQRAWPGSQLPAPSFGTTGKLPALSGACAFHVQRGRKQPLVIRETDSHKAQGLAYRACPPHPPQTSSLASTWELLTRSQVKPLPSGSEHWHRAQLPPPVIGTSQGRDDNPPRPGGWQAGVRGHERVSEGRKILQVLPASQRMTIPWMAQERGGDLRLSKWTTSLNSWFNLGNKTATTFEVSALGLSAETGCLVLSAEG